jgi:hypothetical protein
MMADASKDEISVSYKDFRTIHFQKKTDVYGDASAEKIVSDEVQTIENIKDGNFIIMPNDYYISFSYTKMKLVDDNTEPEDIITGKFYPDGNIWDFEKVRKFCPQGHPTFQTMKKNRELLAVCSRPIAGQLHIDIFNENDVIYDTKNKMIMRHPNASTEKPEYIG